MVVDDLDIRRATGCPHEANPHTVVNPNTMLPGTISAQGFQMIARRYTQILQSASNFKLPEFTPSHILKTDKPLYSHPLG